MRWIRSIGAAVTAGFVAATTAQAQPTSEARIQELVKQAAARLAQAGTAQQPTAAPGVVPADTRPTVQLTLDDAVKLALDRNLDIAVQRLNPEISDIAIGRVLTTYHPTVSSTLATASTSTPANTALAGSNTPGAAIDTTTDTYNGGLLQNFKWGGGNVSLNLINTRGTTTSANTLFNPAYNTNWAAVYTQPLLRNFRTDLTRQQLQVTRLNRDVSDVQLRATITNTISNVREAYWNYVYGVQAVAVAQESVNLAEQLVKDNQTRLEVGTMAPIDVVTAQSQAATARQNLVLAVGTMNTNEVALKRLIVNGTSDANWSVHLDPVDRPEFAPQPVDLDAAIRRALSERTDLQIVKKDVQMNDVTLRYLNDQLKPQVDAVTTYGVVGLGGTQLIKSGGNVNNTTIIGTVPGGYLDALSPLFQNKFPRWTFQVNFSYPLGTSLQEASVARARVQLNQVQAQIKQVELQVATDVTNAVINVQSNAQRVQAAQAARELAQKTMEAEQSKFEVGMSTNYNVVLTQRDLATAENNELQAILNYRIALVELERLQQTTLATSNITLLTTQ